MTDTGKLLTGLLLPAIAIELAALTFSVNELQTVAMTLVALAMVGMCIAKPRIVVVFLYSFLGAVVFVLLSGDSASDLALWTVGMITGIPMFTIISWLNQSVAE